MNATTSLNAQSLRSHLMDPEPMQRVIGLHALECVAAQAESTHTRLAHEAQKFISRGIPFYQPHGGHYSEWVERTVSYWERLQD